MKTHVTEYPNDEKRCSRCREVLPVDQFAIVRKRSGGGYGKTLIVMRVSHCRECKRKANRESYVRAKTGEARRGVYWKRGTKHAAVDNTIPQFTPAERAKWDRNLEALKAKLVRSKVKRWRERVA